MRIALNLKGISWQHVGVHLLKAQHRAPEYLKLNPAGLVPTLVADDGAVLTQSLAIMEYLDDANLGDKPLLPPDPVDRAHVRGLALALACDVHPLNNVRVLNCHHWRARRQRRPEVGMARSLDDALGLEAFGENTGAVRVQRSLLLWRPAHHGRLRPGAANVLGAALQCRCFTVSAPGRH